MVDVNDHALLREFVRNGSEAAFGELVARYVNLVYSTALRATRNPHDAEEITQAVFVVLARKAAHLKPGIILAGWLYQTARLTAANFVRGERRRQRREQEAFMQSSLSEPQVWERIAPLLEQAMGTLGETDHNALVLRFFENKTNREVGVALHVTEAAAHQRVSRALEKLRRFFAKRGLALTTMGLSAAISANSVQAAPAGLAGLAVAAVHGAGAASPVVVLAAEILQAMRWSKVKWSAIAGTAAVTLTAVIGVALENKSVVRAAPAERVPSTGVTSTTPQTVAATPAIAATNRYELTEIQPPPGFAVHVAALNNRGQIVGSLDSTNHETHTFIWDRGTITDLGTFGASKSLATGINDEGDIVGLFLANGARHVFLRANGEIFDLGIIDHFAKLGDEGDKYNGGPGIIYYAPRVAVNSLMQVAGRLTVENGNQRSFLLNQGAISYFGLIGNGNVFEAEKLNNHGQILGRATQNGGPMRSMLWQSGELIDLGFLGGTRSVASALNDLGTVVGSLVFSNDTSQAFGWQKGELRRLPAGQSRSTHATAINNPGQIVGFARGADNHNYACLWSGNEMVDLNQFVELEPGWRLSLASEINDRGQILVRASNGSESRDYLLSPMKPPALLEEPVTATPPPEKNLPQVEPFNLSTFERLPSGAFRLGFTGSPHGIYVIQASTNLVDWSLLAYPTNIGGKIEFTDEDAKHFTLRFYRAVMLR